MRGVQLVAIRNLASRDINAQFLVSVLSDIDGFLTEK